MRLHHHHAVTAAVAAALALSGCTVFNPSRVKEPSEALPESFRFAPASAPSSPVFGTLGWKEIYTDAPLQQLIDEALAAGPDALLAASRVREAQAVSTATRAGQLPSAALQLSTTPTARRPGDTLTSSFLGALAVSWDLDLWGRYASASEAARADLMGSEASRHAVQASLVVNTAALYYQLAAQREVLAVTEAAAANQREVLRIVRKLSQAGVSSAAEERQQENVLASTEAALPTLKRQIAEIETALSVLVGRAPGSLRFQTPAALSLPAELPAGLPSALLERRPDLVQARARLEAANARVNEARARFYPDISLTGVFGRVSTTLVDVLTGGASAVASLGPSVLLPLYSGGALQGNEDAALARLDQAVIGYRKTVLVALGEVSDSLIAYETSAELIAAQERRVVSSRESLRLADMRFKSGVIGFVEVLDAQRQVLAAETDAAKSLLERRLALGRVYLALGGGWDANDVVVPDRRAASTTP